MRLKTLRLHGFKSFADRTTFEFREGITAIIGSNGCGKSNIADAIRWALGEQRASAMRGAKMEEVIFQGTARRRPLSFAEVSLLFDNQSGRVPIPQTELDLARKVFREGGSEYSLNRTACRLRDVQSLLRDTGLGANAYSIIEATMIETLLSDRAEERRSLFEEAAGIGRYKDSRRAATRRLETAEVDLTRLEDLIAEVESKVRSLDRQRKRAERYRQLRMRRLDLEVSIAQGELERLEDGLRSVEARRAALDDTQTIAGAERSAAEAALEERRIEAGELGRQRTDRAGRLESIRSRIDTREREVLLAEERRSNAEAGLERLAAESTDLGARVDVLRGEIGAAVEERGRAQVLVEQAGRQAAGKAEANIAIRAALTAEREASEAAVVRARDLARELAMAEGDRATEDRGRSEALKRMDEVRAQLQSVIRELTQMSGQTELWQAESEELRERIAVAGERLEEAHQEVIVHRGREQRAREEAQAAEDRFTSLSAQVEAREALESSYEGFSPAVSAVMARREEFHGVHGPLADFLQLSEDPGLSRRIEGFLGPLLQGIVIEDFATAREIRRWFHTDWKDGGSLFLLPLEAIRGQRLGVAEDAPGPAVWADVFLADLDVGVGDPLADFVAGRSGVGEEGEVIDPRGVIKLIKADGRAGILQRREALARLRDERKVAVKGLEARMGDRDELRSALTRAEERSLEAQEWKRVTESRLKGLELDSAAHQDRRTRLQQERDSLQTSLRELEQSTVAAAERMEELGTRVETLSRSVEASAADEDAARRRLTELEGRWDGAKEEEGSLQVGLARAESELRDVARRCEAAERSRTDVQTRLRAIGEDADGLRTVLDELSSVREEASVDIEKLFADRDEEAGALALLDARLAEVDSELAELGERTRRARRTESEAGEERHKLELQLAEIRSQIERVRERLEVEWGRPWGALVEEATPVEATDLGEWRSELGAVTERLEGLGPVNMLAMEEHAEEVKRLEFLLAQRDDLVESRNNLVAAIRQINRTAREVFEATFDAVRSNFTRTFQSLFQGGECDIRLADPNDPLESAVEIQASPLGKRTQRIHLLSGGERTLTALALLFALYLVKPSPFCVLDEVDAPLDESNVGRFIRLLYDFKHETQFVVITHNPQTMESADWVYGVTMEEPGVSSIVGVELLGARDVPLPTAPSGA
ncbi:MAG: AAA family ATPase [Gemmatimonas sp.]|nr:AAA family ATPase [Gemmatimonas sp.]